MTTRRWRRLRMGLETVLGVRRAGFFIPYRYAATVAPPRAPYAAIEAAMADAEPAFAALLDQIDALGDALRAIEGPPPAPRWAQDWYPRLDAAAAYALLRGAPPRRVVEVGSGHSTRFVARALRDAGARAEHVCIDPAPRAALAGLPTLWRAEVLSEAHLPLFAALEPGDVAFFDSSHILMPGTDVDLILNRILPVLRPGVRVHVHDVFLPDPYPPEWAWRGYNEQNALAGWILGGALRPIFSSRYALTRMQAARRPALAALPWTGAPESALWLERAG
ncbi:class I SAM-dependent methyltransferase [Oceanicella actignis]|uniref:Predicted O-methyltransferase YrrM n=1 Tax=Oceanicella actignis TaxID=1189325 RepID=A0A1M7TNT9_9RHOB|nr:class I SAM-dependent methyltransferase [Oceanicella actignis]SET73144.1 Predicted O-methyltransferase YrrM [Oceanicella actignis]SHN72411.1 Predicted O-methyltransferase YrrM [Oceanicella actignis]